MGCLLTDWAVDGFHGDDVITGDPLGMDDVIEGEPERGDDVIGDPTVGCSGIVVGGEGGEKE